MPKKNCQNGKGLVSDLAGAAAKAAIGPLAGAIAKRIAKRIEPRGGGTKLAGRVGGGTKLAGRQRVGGAMKMKKHQLRTKKQVLA